MRRFHLMRYVTALFACLITGLTFASDVQVIAMKGNVALRSRGQLVSAKLDGTLPAPVEVRTGADGMVTLRQLGSELNVGPNSVVILPQVAQQRGARQRIEQQSGRVLYQVDRKDREFVVETRHLVSVVKGTVFSVAAETSGTQVSLLEGSLEVSAPGIELPVLLKPNESATRSADGARIEVRAADLFAPPATTSPTTTTALNQIAAPAPPTIAAAATASVASNAARVQTDLGDLVAAISDRRATVVAPPVVPPAAAGQSPDTQPESQEPSTPTPGTPGTPIGVTPPETSPPVVTPPVVTPPVVEPPVVTPPVVEPPVGTPPVVTPPVVTPPVVTPPPVVAPPVVTPPVATPPPVVIPPPPPDDDDDDGLCVLNLVCIDIDIDIGDDDDDDGNNGHGNDEDGDDDSNPGHGHGRPVRLPPITLPPLPRGLR